MEIPFVHIYDTTFPNQHTVFIKYKLKIKKVHIWQQHLVIQSFRILNGSLWSFNNLEN